MAHKLGVWGAKSYNTLPNEASLVVVTSPDYSQPNLLENPGFEFDFLAWRLKTPSGTTPMTVEIRPGYIGKSLVLTSNEVEYKGGFSQTLQNVPPSTTIRYKAVVKTVDVENLQTRVLYRDVSDAEGNWYGGDAGTITGSSG